MYVVIKCISTYFQLNLDENVSYSLLQVVRPRVDSRKYFGNKVFVHDTVHVQCKM